MKNLWLGGAALVVILMLATYIVAGDAFKSDDYINTLTMIGAFAVISITVFVALKYVNQIKNDKAEGKLADENWDGIGEFLNPIPSGWGIMFIATLVWSFWYYFYGYPTNGFSQVGQYNEEVQEYNKKFEEKFKNPDAETLKSMGASLFLVQCAPCHGADAEGIDGKAQDLTVRLFKKSVLAAIEKGSEALGPNPTGNWGYGAGMMPAGLVSGADAEAVAEYVANGFSGNDKGKEVYNNMCASCHGEDGKGMYGTAPNLKEYDDQIVTAVLKHGKKGIIGTMPNFHTILNDTQMKALATYLRSLQGDK